MWEVFEEFVASEYTPCGVQEMREYLQPDRMRRRLTQDFFALVAAVGGHIVGAVEVRDNCHISLLFVRREWQGRGVGRRLVEHAVSACRQRDPDVRRITLQALPQVVAAYRHWGFRATGDEKREAGRVFIPMVLTLPEALTE